MTNAFYCLIIGVNQNYSKPVPSEIRLNGETVFWLVI